MEKKTSSQPKERKLTAAQIAKKEEQARQKIAFNLDNYQIVADICLALLQVEDTSVDVKDKANQTLIGVLTKIQEL